MVVMLNLVLLLKRKQESCNKEHRLLNVVHISWIKQIGPNKKSADYKPLPAPCSNEPYNQDNKKELLLQKIWDHCMQPLKVINKQMLEPKMEVYWFQVKTLLQQRKPEKKNELLLLQGNYQKHP